MNRLKELLEELRLVFSGRGSRLLDSLLPLLVYLVTQVLMGFNFALWGSLVVAVTLALYRIIRRESLVYSLGGAGGVLIAALLAKISGSEVGYFLPGLISGVVTVVLCVVSVVFNRPLVAWTSFIIRRWPLKWYWHPNVLPAYNEVTIMWAVAFSLRLTVEFLFFQRGAFAALGAARVFLGWPFTIILLIVSYLYGLWRLGQLKGPSVEEFKASKEFPWDGQRRGF
jgi:hypothetical protein